MTSTHCSEMSRTYTTLLGWLLAVVLVAGVATLGVAAAEFEGDRPTSAEAGSELELDVTLTEPFAVGDEWTMAVSTELDDARLQITPRDGAGEPIEGKVVDEVDPEIVTVEIDDSSISTIDFSVRGDVPLIDSARYSYEDRELENVTALEVQEQFNGAIRGIENGLFEVHRFTEDSRNARQAIDAASVAVDDADSDDARDRLDEAIDFYDNADFDNAITAAEDAEDIADSEGETRRTLLLVGGVVLALAAVGGVAYYWRSQQQPANKLQ